MSKIKTRVVSSVITADKPERVSPLETFPAVDRRESDRRMAVAKVVYDETGDLIKQLNRLCNGSAFVIQHDHPGWYVQVQEWEETNSVAAARKSSWKPITGIHYNLHVSLEEAIKHLVKKKVIQPPDPIPVIRVEEAATVNQEALDRALAVADNPDPTLQDLLGKQVSAEKRNARGGITNAVAGTLVMKSFSSDTGEEYGVEYKDSGNHKRSVAVKSDSIVVVPFKEDLHKSVMLENDNIAGPINTAASIVAEF